MHANILLAAVDQFTWIVRTILFVSSRAAIAVEVPKEAVPRWNPRTIRPSFLYCSIGSQTKSLSPWTEYERKKINIDRGVKQLKVKSWTSALILEMTFTAVSVPDCFLLKKKKVIKADSEMSATIKKILSNKEMLTQGTFQKLESCWAKHQATPLQVN